MAHNEPRQMTAAGGLVRSPADSMAAMIATGGTALAALTMLTEWGLTQNQIKMVSVVGSAQGVKHIAEEFPDVEIFIGAVDDELTEKGYISPGLGDAVSERDPYCGYLNHVQAWEGITA